MDKKPYLRKILYIDAKLLFTANKDQVIIVSNLNFECIYETAAQAQASSNKNCIFKIFKRKSDYWKETSLEYLLEQEGLLNSAETLNFYKIVKP